MIDQISYQHARRIARRIQAKALADYQKKVLEKLSHGSNDRAWWKMTRSLSGLSKSSRRAAPNVDVLGGFFASKFSLSDDFAAQLPTLPCEFPDITIKNSWRIRLSRVRTMLKNLDVNKAVGPDCISPRILCNCYWELSRPLTMLFCRICRSGVFPKSWEVARVTPVFKHKGSAADPAFYRLVSVMPTLALLFERVISSQMYNFITPFIPQNQYGIMKGTGAQDCGETIAFIATQALNCRQELRIVSLDIKGAFDKIWWDGLLHHLWTIGVHQKAFSLLKSYLSDCYLFVVANGKESSLYPVMTGVPQGGVWSPLLFNLYVCHLPS